SADIGSFGIVVVADTVYFSDKFKPVLETGEFLQSFLNRLPRNAGRLRHGDGSHHIFNVMNALNFHSTERKLFLFGGVAPNNFIAVSKAPLSRFKKTKENHTRSDSPSHSPHQGIIAVQHRHIIVFLRCEDSFLGTTIGSEIRVAIQMV